MHECWPAPASKQSPASMHVMAPRCAHTHSYAPSKSSMRPAKAKHKQLIMWWKTVICFETAVEGHSTCTRFFVQYCSLLTACPKCTRTHTKCMHAMWMNDHVLMAHGCVMCQHSLLQLFRGPCMLPNHSTMHEIHVRTSSVKGPAFIFWLHFILGILVLLFSFLSFFSSLCCFCCFGLLTLRRLPSPSQDMHEMKRTHGALCWGQCLARTR